MKLIRGIKNVQAHHHGCVLTIGNFDGVHRGHQTLLTQLKQQALARGVPMMVMIFEPQPLELFAANNAPARLMSLREKVKYLAQAQVDYLLCVKFDSLFAAYTPREFIVDLLVKKLGATYLVVGDDFRFGANRQGDFELLQRIGRTYGLEVTSAATQCEEGLRISSTAIREALQKDNLPLAQKLLGRPYSISGRVVHGNALGVMLGFPTANVPLKRKVIPVRGVYTVEVYGLGPQPLPGVANIGTRPTVSGVVPQLEVHLLDVSRDLYGRNIEVVLRSKLRDEQHFASLDALKQQIANDVVAARDFFGLQAPNIDSE